jgi:hypothetical protein
MAAAGDFNIRRFDITKLKDHKTAVVVGRRGTGKTTLITDILYHKRNLPAGLVVSGTEEGNNYYKSFVPNSFIYNSYDEEVVKRLIERQKNLKRLKAKHSDCFLLLDDCLFNSKFLKSETMRFLFMNGRHFNLMLILAAQYLMDIPAAIRANCDYVFAFQDPIVTNRKRLYDHFYGIFRSFPQFEAVYKACTADFECLVLDNTQKSSNPEDCVFWYRAEEHKPFKIGAPAYWAFDKKQSSRDKDDETSVTTVNGIKIRKSR